ncbi:hypothetical protein M8J76_005680 [Diaphorina citri]|nr:hypothetical protein M8J75_006677 [Diaphorina citri]KAI5713798.1 hypothetical protein M8J76_005680 [Diaphorina citri]
MLDHQAWKSFGIRWIVLGLIWCQLAEGAGPGFGAGLEDLTSDHLFGILEPRIKDVILSKHLDPAELSPVTFDYPVLPTIFLYNGNLTGLSLFRNESVRSTWDPMVRLVNMDLQLIFPELRMNYQWRSIIGKGSLVYIINNMLMDLSFILDLQRLQLKIQTVRFDNRKATTEIGVKSKVITSILNALRNRLKGLNNWVLNPVTERMNLAILEELRETNIDLYELLGIKHLYSVPKTG